MSHRSILLVILFCVSVAYIKVSDTYFCSYDDFNELRRAAFEDAQQPSRILTTTHFNSYKYRPLNRAVNLWTYLIGQGHPVWFRIRNLAFHLANIVLVYALGWLLFRSARISGFGAALFSLHPLANQSIIGAVMTNTMAHAGFLLALVMFIVSMRAKRFWSLWLVGSVASGWLGLLAYDSGIVVFGLMCFYLFAELIIGYTRGFNWRFFFVFSSATTFFVGSYLLLRLWFVPRGWTQVTAASPSLGVVAKNLATYAFALLSPLDLVLANEWINSPLPSEIVLSSSTLAILALLALPLALALIAAICPLKKSGVTIADGMDRAVPFLMCAILAPLTPVLLFEGHPSETYLYLPLAFYALLLSYGINRLVLLADREKEKAVFAIVAFFLVGLSFSATWVRNGRVIQCGDTARRILASVPDELLRQPDVTLLFANSPGEKATRRYGYYGFHGVDTIGDGEAANGAMTSALQLMSKNETSGARILNFKRLSDECRDEHARCFLVHWDGRLETFLPPKE